MQADNQPVALFRLPFRPLFLFAAIFSVLCVGAWGMYWFSPFPFTPFGGLYWWHGHEMIFGFAGAVLVGFLLTAAKNWTGLPGTRGLPLAIMVGAWLIARALIVLGEADWQIGVILFTACFWLMAIGFFAYMILKVRMWRNFIMVLVLLIMGIMDVASILSIRAGGNYLTQLHGGILLIMLALTIIGGRVLPFFTASAIGAEMVKPQNRLEVPVLLLTIGLFAWNLVYGLLTPSIVLAGALSVLVFLHIARFLRWNLADTLPEPMLWSLHLAYLFMVLGIALLAGYHFGLVNSISTAFHAITIGAIGGMILSMISRVSLGHTGRKIEGGRWLTFSFVLIFLAATIRVAAPVVLADQYWSAAYHVSACLWCVAYIIWLIRFLPILLTPRPDGKPG